MKLDQTFRVTAPIEGVWAALMDVEQVAGCVPGAQVLEQLSADSYQVGMKVKLGPISMAYRGRLDVVERDEAAHHATLSGKAQETRGQGTASATVQLQLSAEGGQTLGTVQADVRLSGRAAAMGQGVITSVADQMLGQFATNLEAMLSESPQDEGPAADESRSGETVEEGVNRMSAGTRHEGVIVPPEEAKPGGSPVERTRGDRDMTGGQVVTGPAGGPADESATPPPSGPARGGSVSGGSVSGRSVSGGSVSGAAQSMAGPRVSDRPAPRSVNGPSRELPPWPAPAGARSDNSLDAVALGRSVLGAQLQQPRMQLALATLLALIAYLLGRRSARD